MGDQLAFFVRAGHVNSLREAFHDAKIGEAHGYRNNEMLTTVAVQTTTTVNNRSSQRGILKHYLQSDSRKKPKVCFRCEGHI